MFVGSRWVSQYVAWALLIYLSSPTRISHAAPTLVWTNPAATIHGVWNIDQSPRTLANISNTSAQLVSGNEFIAAPASAGDTVSVNGVKGILGLGQLAGAELGAVVWLPEQTTVRIPVWFGPVVVVAKSGDGSPTELQLRLSSGQPSAERFERFESEALSFIRAPLHVAPPTTGEPDIDATVRYIAALKQAMPTATRSTMAALEQEFERELSRHRPLSRPYFTQANLEFHCTSIKTNPTPLPATAEWTRLQRGHQATLRNSGHPIRLEVRFRRPSQNRLHIFQDGIQVRSIEKTLSVPGGQHGWTAPAFYRFPSGPGRAPLRLHVEEGEVLVRASRFSRASYFFDRRALPTQSGAPSEPVEARDREDALDAALDDPLDAALEEVPVIARQRAQTNELRHAVLLMRALAKKSQSDAATLTQLRHVAGLLRAMPPAHVAPLYRNLLAQMWRRSVQLEEVPIALGCNSNGVHQEDAVVIKALSSLIAVTPVDGSLQTAALLDALLLKHPSRRLKKLARALYRRAGALSAIPIIDALDSRLHFSPARNGIPTQNKCSLKGPYGIRWTRVDKPTCLDVAATSGTHTLVSLRTDDTSRDAEVSVGIDDTAIHVHGSVGLPGRAAVRPGRRCFRPSAQVMARVPRIGSAPCSQLQDVSRQYQISGSAHATLPQRPAPSYLSVQLAKRADEEEPTGRREVSVKVGTKTYSIWSSGDFRTQIKLPLPADVSTVGLDSTSAQWIRILTRSVAKPEASPRPMSLLRDSYAAAELNVDLTHIRNLSRQLLTTQPGTERSELLDERASILSRIGQVSLALGDREESRRGAAALAPSDAQFSLEQTRPTRVVQQGRSPTGAALTAAAPDVVAVGYASTIAPIPGSVSRTKTAQIRHWLRDGFTASDVEGFFESNRPPGDAEALLWAVLAQRAGVPAQGARALSAIGQQFNDGQALARAVKLRTDGLERWNGNRIEFERALLRTWGLLHEAEAMGGSTLKSRGRLRARIAYQKPSTVGGTAGRALVELSDPGSNTDNIHRTQVPATIGLRTRRALTLAGEGGTYVSANRHVVIRDESLSQLTLTGRCHTPKAGLPCRLLATVNGLPAACHSLGPSPRVQPHRTSPLMQCKLQLPNGATRVEGFFGGGRDAFGWISAYDAVGNAIGRRTVSEWHEIDEGRPMTLSILGPTVLRVVARSMIPATRSPTSQTLKVSFNDEGAPAHSQRLVQERDNQAHLFVNGSARALPALTMQSERNVVISQDGPVTVTLAVDRGRVLVSPSIAVPSDQAHTLPDVATHTPVVDSPSETGRHVAAPKLNSNLFTAYTPSNVGDVTERGPVSLSGRVSLVGRDLMEGDNDQPGTYLATRLTLRRELSRGAVWMRASLLARERFAGESLGADASLQWRIRSSAESEAYGNGQSFLESASESSLLPGGFLRGRIVGQSLPDRTGVGANVHAGLRWSFPVSPTWKLLPTLSGSLRRTDRQPNAATQLDPDVYSAWAHDNPRTLDIKLTHLHNAYLDLVLLYSTSMRLTHDLNHLDRLQTTARLEALPFGPFPFWFKLKSQLGHRPRTRSRLHPFTRIGMKLSGGAFHWLSADCRLSLQGNVSFRMDLASSGLSQNTAFAGISLGVDYLPGTGLADFAPSERRFRTTMESGASITRAIPRTAPQNWTIPDVP